MFPVLGTVQQAGPQEAVVMVDGSQMVDPFDADRLFFEQIPVRIEPADGPRRRGEIVFFGQRQSLRRGTLFQLALLDES